LTTLLFSKRSFQDIQGFLFEKAPRENGCFILANSYHRSGGEVVMIATEMLRPNEKSWNQESEHSLEPNSSYTNASVVRADSSNSGLIFAHTHPGVFHPPTFSPIDEDSNRRLFQNLCQILPNRPLGSIVLSRKGVNGVAYENSRITPFSEIKIIGGTYSTVTGKEQPLGNAQGHHLVDRQILAIGIARQATLDFMKIAIIGAGGTGSAVAVQLARMGVESLLLVDKDRVDESNISRVYGTKRKDVGKPKVSVLKKNISTFSRTKVDAIYEDVSAEHTLSQLFDSDLIFGCTDNLTSRSVLNDFSLRSYIPLIDIGCRIHLDDSGSIEQEIAKVQVVTPDNACLWCTGTLDGKVILQESLPRDEKKRLSREGYYETVENQPSVISLTTLAASLGINKLLGLLGAFGDNPTSRTQLELRNGFMVDDSPKIRDDCICAKLRGLGEKRHVSLRDGHDSPVKSVAIVRLKGGKNSTSA